MLLSSSFEKSQRRTVSVSLNSLPEDLLVEISSRVAASSSSEIRNLQLVSKSFQRLCNDPYVLHRHSFNEIPLFPWRNCGKISEFVIRCRKSGNTEATYRDGLLKYFHRNSNKKQQDIGLKFIAKASRKGNQEARYIYGLILIYLGGQAKQKGFKLLSSLRQPLMLSTILVMGKHRKNLRRDLWWCGTPMMTQLKRSYVRENCNCDGKTETFLYSLRKSWHEDKDMKTSSACEICLCNREVQLFFDYND